jgi:hypothetical protein
MIEFLVGLFIGTFIGICIMCLMSVAKDDERIIDEGYRPKKSQISGDKIPPHGGSHVSKE